MITLTNALQGLSKSECLQTLSEMGIAENTRYVYDNIRSLHKMKGGSNAQKLENLLKQVHYSQLINFDYKFASKSDRTLSKRSHLPF